MKESHTSLLWITTYLWADELSRKMSCHFQILSYTVDISFFRCIPSDQLFIALFEILHRVSYSMQCS